MNDGPPIAKSSYPKKEGVLRYSDCSSLFSLVKSKSCDSVVLIRLPMMISLTDKIIILN
jgi:hypothetical protein